MKDSNIVKKYTTKQQIEVTKLAEAEITETTQQSRGETLFTAAQHQTFV